MLADQGELCLVIQVHVHLPAPGFLLLDQQLNREKPHTHLYLVPPSQATQVRQRRGAAHRAL